MRSIQVEENSTRVGFHCSTVVGDCTIDGCGCYDLSKASEISWYHDPNHDSITYRIKTGYYGMRAKKGQEDIKAEVLFNDPLIDSGGLVLQDFEDRLDSQYGWEEPKWIPQVDDLTKMREAISGIRRTENETAKVDEQREQQSINQGLFK